MSVIRISAALILTVLGIVRTSIANENGHDFTLVLQPQQDTNWTEIRHWAKQHGIPLESIEVDAAQHSPALTDAADHTTPRSPVRGHQLQPKTGSRGEAKWRPSRERKLIRPGPAFKPKTMSRQQAKRRPSLTRKHLRPGPAQIPGVRRVGGRRKIDGIEPGPALILSRNPRVPDNKRESISTERAPVDVEPRAGATEQNDGESTGQLLFRLEPIVNTVPPPQHLRLHNHASLMSDAAEEGEDYGVLSRDHAQEDRTDAAPEVDGEYPIGSNPPVESASISPVQSEDPLRYSATQISVPPVRKQDHRVIQFTPQTGQPEPRSGLQPTPLEEVVTDQSTPAIEARHHAPDVLATLLQRLEDRLMAAESLQRQQAAQLQNLQHSRRKQEVSAAEQREDIRTQFDNLEHKTGNLQSDLDRASSLLETVLGEMRTMARRQRQRPAAGAAAGGSEPEQLHATVRQLSEQLSQLTATAEQLRSAHKNISGSLRSLRNSTRDLADQSDQCATEEMMLRNAADIRSFIQQQLTTNYHQRPVTEDDMRMPGDCSETQLAPTDDGGVSVTGARSGVHQVWPRGAGQPFLVFCDMDTDGGGWTVIQRRSGGEQDFYKDWVAYKHGFGSLTGEFWLGNEHIHQLTTHRPNSLRVELSDFPRERPGLPAYPGSNATASYASFALASEVQGYALRVLDGYSGDAGDSLRYHAGARFSTKDTDNDLWEEDSCARAHKGGWWYKGCDSSNLNGLYLSGPVPAEYEYQGAYWHDWRGPRYSLYRTVMMVRPSDHSSRLQRAGGNLLASTTEEPLRGRAGAKSKRRRNRRKKGRHG